MGRTLHYAITKPTGFTPAELDKLLAIQKLFNTGFEWTCENLDLHPAKYYPKWDYWRSQPGTNTPDDVWKKINARIKHWEKEGLHALDAIQAVANEGLISADIAHREKRGFTKTQGNELNSLLVLEALLAASRAIPEALLTLSDEGRFLYCNLQIRNGQARPDLDQLKNDLTWRLASIASDPTSEIVGKIPALRKLSDAVAGDLMRNYGGAYGAEEELRYLNETLNDAALVLPLYEAAYIKAALADPDRHAYFEPLFCAHNTKDFFVDPHLLHRPVNPEDFKDFGHPDHHIMEGFYGEHWGINVEDPEAESLKLLAKLQPLMAAANNKLPKAQRLTVELNVAIPKGR